MSKAPKEAPVRKYLPSSVYLEEKTDEQKKEEVRMSYISRLMMMPHVVVAEWTQRYFSRVFLTLCVRVAQLLSAMVAKLGHIDDPLPQDSFEGVDEDEWVSERDGNLDSNDRHLDIF